MFDQGRGNQSPAALFCKCLCLPVNSYILIHDLHQIFIGDFDLTENIFQGKIGNRCSGFILIAFQQLRFDPVT